MSVNAIPLSMDGNHQVRIPVWVRKAIGVEKDVPMKAIWDSREQMIVVIPDFTKEEYVWKDDKPKELADKFK